MVTKTAHFFPSRAVNVVQQVGRSFGVHPPVFDRHAQDSFGSIFQRSINRLSRSDVVAPDFFE